MKDQTEIENRLRGLLCQELDRRIAEATRRLPRNCSHNYRHPLDHRKTVEGSPNPSYNQITRSLPVARTMGLCMLDSENREEWKGDICEDPIDAKACPYFQRKVSVEDVYEQFLTDLETKELSGEVKALFWVLAETSTKLPWWKTFWFKYILRVDYEPLGSDVPVRRLARDLLPEEKEYIDTVDNP